MKTENKKLAAKAKAKAKKTFLENQVKGLKGKCQPPASNSKSGVAKKESQEESASSSKSLNHNVKHSQPLQKYEEIYMEEALEEIEEAEEVEEEMEEQEDEEENDDEHIAEEHVDGSHQLYGQDFDGEPMVNIGNGVYCRRKIYNMAIGSSAFPSHLARKILDGVFKTEALVKCTLTGIAPRAQGKARQEQYVEQLNLRGRHAIVEFAIRVGQRKKMVSQDIKVIERAISQRIGEIKRLYEKRRSMVHENVN